MKKLLFVAVLIFTFTGVMNAQVRNSSGLTFGLDYPRLAHSGLDYADVLNYGGFFGLQHFVTDNIGFRGVLNINALRGNWGGGGFGQINSAGSNAFSWTYSFNISGDFIYNFTSGESVTPYFTIGGGPSLYFLDNRGNTSITSSTYITLQINSSFGIEWFLSDAWKLKTELMYVTVLDAKFDGTEGVSNTGLFGAYPSYFELAVGLNYYFTLGESPKTTPQLYPGLSEEKAELYKGLSPEKIKLLENLEKIERVDYDKIETIVKNNIPKEVVKQVVVEKPVEKVDNWVLVGINFETNKATFTPEAQPILFYAAQTLLLHPDIKVEIQGYTDSRGSEKYNMKLAERRADAVKNYLVARGVSADRLKTAAFGEAKPIASNDTNEGKAMNRRIEFKVIR